MMVQTGTKTKTTRVQNVMNFRITLQGVVDLAEPKDTNVSWQQGYNSRFTALKSRVLISLMYIYSYHSVKQSDAKIHIKLSILLSLHVSF